MRDLLAAQLPVAMDERGPPGAHAIQPERDPAASPRQPSLAGWPPNPIQADQGRRSRANRGSIKRHHELGQKGAIPDLTEDRGRRDQVIYYQYKADRARRTLRGIDEQVKKAEQAVAGKAPVKRNRFIQLAGGTRSVNRELEAKARALAGIKGYITNLAACPDGTPVTGEFVIGAYHRLFEIERSFRMSKHDLQARPIYHRKRDSIEAHLTIVFAALAVSRWIEDRTGWSIRKFVRTARRYRTIEIQAGQHNHRRPPAARRPPPGPRPDAPTPGPVRRRLSFRNAPVPVRQAGLAVPVPAAGARRQSSLTRPRPAAGSATPPDRRRRVCPEHDHPARAAAAGRAAPAWQRAFPGGSGVTCCCRPDDIAQVPG